MRTAAAFVFVPTFLLAACCFAAAQRPASGNPGPTLAPRASTVNNAAAWSRHRPSRGSSTSSGASSATSAYTPGGSNTASNGSSFSGFTPARELAPRPASDRWLYVDPPSPDTIERQKARDDAFWNAVDQARKDYWWKPLPSRP